MMKEFLKDKKNKVGIFTFIAVAVAVVGIFVTVLTMFVAHPTSAHREVAAEVNKLWEQNPLAAGGSAEYKALESTPEFAYSLTAGIASGILSVLVSIALIGLIYFYLRKHQITQKATAATVWLTTLGFILALPALRYLEVLMLDKSYDWVNLIYMAIGQLTIGALLTYFVVLFFKWRYDKKHSFAI